MAPTKCRQLSTGHRQVPPPPLLTQSPSLAQRMGKPGAGDAAQLPRTFFSHINPVVRSLMVPSPLSTKRVAGAAAGVDISRPRT